MKARAIDGAALTGTGVDTTSAPARRYRQLLETVDRLSYWVIALTMTVMVTLVTAQVILRYFFAGSIDWADEMSRLAFVWSIFLALPHGIKKGIHVGIDILIERFSPTLREGIMRLMLACSAVLMVIVMAQAVSVARDSWSELMPTVDLSVAVFYIAVVVSMGHAFLHLGYLVWQGTKVWEDE